MSSVDDLVAWLRAQVDEDERVAQEAADRDSGRWFFGEKWNVYRAEDIGGDDGEVNQLVVYGNVKPQSEHIALHDPARVLREVEAKRAIIDRHALKSGERHAICAECGGSDWKPAIGHDGLDPYPWVMPWPCPTLRLLALPYSDRPGYREEWKP